MLYIWNEKTDSLYPSAPLENIDLERRFEKNLNDVNSFKNHIINSKEMITYFKYENNKSKKKYEKYKTFTTILISFDTFVIIATTSSSFTLSLTGIGLVVIPISTSTASGLPVGKKVVNEMIINKYIKYKKLCERAQQSIKSFDNIYRESLQGNVIKKKEYDSLGIIFSNSLDETKNDFFYKNEQKQKNNFLQS